LTGDVMTLGRFDDGTFSQWDVMTVKRHLCRVAGITLCDPTWHVSSSSGVATSVSELLYPCYLLYFTLQCRLGGAEAYLRTKCHLDPSSRLATINMDRKVGCYPPFWEGEELGPHQTQCGLG